MSIIYQINNKNYLLAHSHYSISLYCKENNISLEEFNMPVIIDKHIKNCSNMFRGCKSFNQNIVIPTGVRYCDYMFYDCTNLNHINCFPDTVISCKHAYDNTKIYNNKIDNGLYPYFVKLKERSLI